MPRAPIDVIPQRRLVYELRAVIDVARHSDPRSMTYEVSVAHLVRLLLENPTASLRAHVKHNLGCVRRRWVRHLSTTLPRSEATDLMWRLGCDTQPVASALEATG